MKRSIFIEKLKEKHLLSCHSSRNVLSFPFSFVNTLFAEKDPLNTEVNLPLHAYVVYFGQFLGTPVAGQNMFLGYLFYDYTTPFLLTLTVVLLRAPVLPTIPLPGRWR